MKDNVFGLLVDQIQKSLKYNKDYAEEYAHKLNQKCLSIYKEKQKNK